MSNPALGPPGSNTPATTTVVLPNIPKATDLPSSIAAVNAIAQAINILASLVGSGGSSSSSTTAATVASGFNVVSQKTQLIRITDPNDATVYVDVEQIVALTLFDPVTKQTWQWTQ